MPFTMDPEVGAGIQNIFGTNPPAPPPVGDIEGRRKAVGAFVEATAALLPKTEDVSSKDYHTKAEDGTEILLRWFTKETSTPSSGNGPAIVYAHGGGMIALSLANYNEVISAYVTRTGVPFLGVEYRLAPEHPAPIPVTDTYAALFWLHEHAAELGVDPSRIAVMGDSGGGGIAAGVTHYAKTKPDAPAIAKQLLIYPMLDDRTTVPDNHILPFATWSFDDNKTAWQAIVGSACGGPDVPPHHAPARMEDATGLPPAFIVVGELDIFRKESVEYAVKLWKAGVSCELHVWPGCPHGFDAFAFKSSVALADVETRVKAIASI
ncbi:hypothetical protein LTR50_005736 [Elasticomyces elasticus]|nr:hypothetical protein LTR50_005736 [Elasticomyces elasticus]